MIFTNFEYKNNSYYLEASDNKNITLKINSILQNNILQKLKELIAQLNINVSIVNKNGNSKNTQQLGKEIIKQFNYIEVKSEKAANQKASNMDFFKIEKGEINLKGDFIWNRIVINSLHYEFGQNFKIKNDDKYVYRWYVERKNEILVYIGETKQFSKRINQYLSPGKDQKTNKRINEIFKNLINEECKIYLDVLNLENILLEEFKLEDSNLKEFRRLFENYFILKAKEIQKFTILNK